MFKAAKLRFWVSGTAMTTVPRGGGRRCCGDGPMVVAEARWHGLDPRWAVADGWLGGWWVGGAARGRESPAGAEDEGVGRRKKKLRCDGSAANHTG